MENTTKNRILSKKSLLGVIQGIIIGAGAILPGISGGVLAVTFGIYEAIIETLADPLHTLKKTWKILLPVGIGWVLGFFVFAGLIGRFYEAAPTVCISAMLGLVAGTFPSLLQETGKHGHSRSDWFVFTVVLFAVSAFMLGFSGESALAVESSWLWMFACGAMWGLSLIVPGMTFSPIIIWLGLFDEMSMGIANFDLSVLLPFILGIVIVALALSKAVNTLYKKRASLASHGVLALAIASTVATIPRSYDSIQQVLFCILAFAVGFVLALLLDKLGTDKD